jgi:hypothetical protein
MTKLLLTAAALVAFAAPALAGSPPTCDNSEVKRTLFRILNGGAVGDIRDLESPSTDKRWCRAPAEIPVQRSTFMRRQMPWKSGVLTYTVEWINEGEGRFFVTPVGTCDRSWRSCQP